MKVFGKAVVDGSLKIFTLIAIQIVINASCYLNPQTMATAHKLQSDKTQENSGKQGLNTRNCLNLEGGHLLLTPDKDIVCCTHEGSVFIGSDATVFVTNIGDKTIVYDLAQTALNKVFVYINSSRIPMWPGLVLVLSKDKTVDFERLDPNCWGVKYSKQRSVVLPNEGLYAFMADFTITSAMTHISSLRELTRSDNIQDKIVVARLLKSAVVAGDYGNM